jgi:hypothetical protein
MTHVADITIDHTLVAADHTDFPLLLDLSVITQTAFWSTVTSTGGDIRIYEDDGTTELAREVVSCDTTAETGEVWIKVPSLSSSVDTVLQVHVDGTSSDYATTDLFGAQEVWSDYAAVYHFNDLGTDSTGNGYDIDGGETPVYDDVLWGRGVDIGTMVNATADAFLTSSTAHTLQVSAEDTASPTTADSGIFGVAASNVFAKNWSVGLFGTNSRTARMVSNDVFSSVTSQTTTSPSGGSPFWLAASYDGAGTTTGFLNYDGELETGSASTTFNNESWNRIAIGQAGDLSPSGAWDGKVAEARIALESRSTEWLTTEYANQSDPGTFYAATDPSAGGGTEIDAALATMSVTTYAATIASAVEISAAVELLELTTLQATLSADNAIDANVKELVLQTNTANVSAGSDIGANTEELVIQTYTAGLSSDREITANLHQMVNTSHQAVISLNKEVDATVQSITLTTNPAVVSNAASISVDVAAIVVDTFAASTSAGSAITAAVQSIQLATNQATVLADNEVTAALHAMSFATNQADVALGSLTDADTANFVINALQAGVILNVQLSGALHEMSAEALAASVGLARHVDAFVQNLEFTPNGAVITVEGAISAAVQQLELTTFGAVVTGDATALLAPGLEYTFTDNRLHYTLPISKIHLTFSEED